MKEQWYILENKQATLTTEMKNKEQKYKHKYKKNQITLRALSLFQLVVMLKKSAENLGAHFIKELKNYYILRESSRSNQKELIELNYRIIVEMEFVQSTQFFISFFSDHITWTIEYLIFDGQNGTKPINSFTWSY